MDEKIKKILENHEERIRKIEADPFSMKKIEQTEKNYKGLGGGLNLLIDNGFFNKTQTLNEIVNEMKREGYHHGKGAVSKMLSVNFVKGKKVLTRIKENKFWKYVVRK